MDYDSPIDKISYPILAKFLRKADVPKKHVALLSFIILTLASLAFGIIVGFYGNNFLEELNAKVNPHAYFEGALQGSQDQEYLPLIIKNFGNKPMTGVWVEASTCFSVNQERKPYYSEYNVGKIGTQDSFTVNFNERKSVSQMKKKQCPPAIEGWQEQGSLSMNPFDMNKGEINTQEILFCNWCGYEIRVHSDQGDYNFTNVFRAPFDTKIEITRTS